MVKINKKIIFLILIVVVLGVAYYSCGQQREDAVTSPDTSPPLLSSPIYSTAETTGIGSLFWSPAPEQELGYHQGIDITFKKPAGGRVKATTHGTVTATNPAGAHADPSVSMRIKYNDKYSVFYVFEPLEEFYVSVGDQVETGEVIGKVGPWEVGDYGPVLHFQVDSYGSPECPMTFFNQETRQEFRNLYNLNTTEGLADPCYQHPTGCPSVHDLW